MTNTTNLEEVLRTDARGRVWTPPERREALLDEFERSGLTGQKFATMIGVKYQTFASWRNKRRQARTGGAKAETSVVKAEQVRPIQWFEAVASATEGSGLQVDLPGGASVKISDSSQVTLAARLLRELALIGRPC